MLYRFPSLVPSEHQVLGSHYIIFTSLSLKEKYNLVSFRWWTQCCRSPPHDCPRKQKRKPLSVSSIIHIYEFQKHHLLNLPTLHICRGKDREIVRERLPIEKCIMGRVFKWLRLEETCFGGCLFIRDFSQTKYTVESAEDVSFWLRYLCLSKPLLERR